MKSINQRWLLIYRYSVSESCHRWVSNDNNLTIASPSSWWQDAFGSQRKLCPSFGKEQTYQKKKKKVHLQNWKESRKNGYLWHLLACSSHYVWHFLKWSSSIRKKQHLVNFFPSVLLQEPIVLGFFSVSTPSGDWSINLFENLSFRDHASPWCKPKKKMTLVQADYSLHVSPCNLVAAWLWSSPWSLWASESSSEKSL